eukprot:1251542-Pyramimonas_sp.AAC.1
MSDHILANIASKPMMRSPPPFFVSSLPRIVSAWWGRATCSSHAMYNLASLSKAAGGSLSKPRGDI